MSHYNFNDNFFETPLTKAVIANDIEAVRKFVVGGEGGGFVGGETVRGRGKSSFEKKSDWQNDILERNGLGFNAIELARYLGRDDCLKILHPRELGGVNEGVLEGVNAGVNEGLRVDVNENRKNNENNENNENSKNKKDNKPIKIKYLPHLVFESYDSMKLAIKNCPNWVVDCALKEKFHPCLEKRVEIRWIDDVLGYGVFAAEPIDVGDYVGEYTGVVRLIPKLAIFCTQIFEAFSLGESISCFKDVRLKMANPYTLRYPQKYFSWNYALVDCREAGNFTRFINHSEDPNLTPRVSIDLGVIRSHFFAKRSIAKGEQLTWNYGPDYWVNRGEFVRLG